MRNYMNRVQFQRFYHGTNVGPEVILKEGLKAHNPAEELNAEYGEAPDAEDPGHPTGVYMSERRKTAEGYGHHLYAMDLPVHADEWGWTESEGAVWRGDIHPYLIKQID